MKRAALLLTLVFAVGASAQETLDMRPKHSAPVDGSLSLTKGNGTGFGLDLGGTLVKDRVWFFASAERTTPMFAQAPQTQVRSLDTKAVANIGDRQNLSAMFANTTAASPLSRGVPSSFLSLHYTATVTPNSFFTMNVSETR